MNKRADQLLVERGLAPSRTKAKELIEQGSVQGISKPSQLVDDSIQLILSDSDLLKYVSRAGLKLESVLKEFNINPEGLLCLDLGASTGGFTDCLLWYGAKHVDAVDVGQGQLHEKLKNDNRVRNLEGQDARDFKGGPYEIIVADLSFISLTKVLHPIRGLASEGTKLALLIKPQFEVGSDNIGKGGIVKSDLATTKALETIKKEMQALGFVRIKLKASGLAGRDGNQEYFIYAEVQ